VLNDSYRHSDAERRGADVEEPQAYLRRSGALDMDE